MEYFDEDCNGTASQNTLVEVFLYFNKNKPNDRDTRSIWYVKLEHDKQIWNTLNTILESQHTSSSLLGCCMLMHAIQLQQDRNNLLIVFRGFDRKKVVWALQSILSRQIPVQEQIVIQTLTRQHNN